MTDTRYKDQATRDEWDMSDIEQKLEMLARNRWPDAFRALPKPKSGPLDDLWDPAPAHLDRHDLEVRFKALTKGCFSQREQAVEAWQDYLMDGGRNLPVRYRNEDDRIIIAKTGEDITDAIDFEREAASIRDTLAHFQRELRYANEAENYRQAEILKQHAEDTAIELAKCYERHGQPLSERQQELLAGEQARMADA